MSFRYIHIFTASWMQPHWNNKYLFRTREPKRWPVYFFHNFRKRSLPDGRNKICERKYNSFRSLLMSQLNGNARLLFYKWLSVLRSIIIIQSQSKFGFFVFNFFTDETVGFNSFMESFRTQFSRLEFLASIADRTSLHSGLFDGHGIFTAKMRRKLKSYMKIMCCHYVQHHMRITTILFRFFIRNLFIIYLAFICVSIYILFRSC